MSLLREAEKCLANQSVHSALNAFVSPLHAAGQWRDRVREADLRREQGKPKSPADGRLISFKDNICTRELPTTCVSGILDTFTSPFNATVVEQLENAGAVVAGKTNLDEFGMGSHSVNSRFGHVRSLHRDADGEALSAGGSSGGAAVAVGSEQCYAGLGTDTGGSIRLPAAYTGTVGFKPSYGLVSRWGVVAYANSLDTVGILGRDTASVRDVFAIVNQPDRRDPTNLRPSSRSRILSHINSPRLTSRGTTSPFTVGVPAEYNISELSPSVRQAWHHSLVHLQKQGHTIRPVSLPATRQALSAYYILAPAEASSNLAKYDGVRYGSRGESSESDAQQEPYLYANTRGHGFGPEVKRRILLGTFSLSAAAVDNYFIQAQRVRRLVQRDFDAVFKAEHPFSNDTAVSEGSDPENAGVDVLVFPTAPFSPPRLSSLMDADARKSPLDAYMNDVLTVPASLAGLPAMSVPVSVGNGSENSENDLSGMQVVGQYGDDELVLKVGELLEGKRF